MGVGPVCVKPGCGKPTWNGKSDEYCSKPCRESATTSAAPISTVGPVCVKPGCGKPAWNGKSDEYCSKPCRESATTSAAPISTVGPVCTKPCCGKLTRNGQPNAYCSRSCRHAAAAPNVTLVKELDAIPAASLLSAMFVTLRDSSGS